MITLLKLSIFLISASLTIASKKRCLRNVKKLKKQNEELQSIIQELEADGEWGSWSSVFSLKVSQIDYIKCVYYYPCLYVYMLHLLHLYLCGINC